LFSSSSQTIPIKFLLFPSITYQNPFVLIKFPNNSHQIPLVPINNPSKSFCSQKVLIKFLLFPLSSHQHPFVPMAMEDRQVSTNDAPSSTLPELPAVRGQARKGATMAGRRLPGAAEQKLGIFFLLVLWKIAGGSASRTAVCRASSFVCATQELYTRVQKTQIEASICTLQSECLFLWMSRSVGRW
jgi:hypothetical protein